MKILKYILVFVFLSTLFFSCSPKVITVTKTKFDTLYKEKISFVKQIEKCQLDTSFQLKGHGYVHIKIDSSKFQFDFEPKKIIQIEETIVIPKDVIKQYKRQEEKTVRKTIEVKRDIAKQENKTERVNIRQIEKTDRVETRAENKTGFFYGLKKFLNYIIIFVVGLILGYFLSKLKILKLF